MTGPGGEVAAPPPPAGSQWRPDVVYGTAGTGGRDLILHLYACEPGERRPGVVFAHGGGWQSGSPAMMLPLAAELAAEGFVTAAISYRLLGEARWPAALEDTKCAVRWLRAHAVGIGLDPDRLAVAGGSAGGHLATLAALTPGRLEGTGVGFHRSLESLGVPNELEIVAGADHGLPVNDPAGCVRATTAFLARYL